MTIAIIILQKLLFQEREHRFKFDEHHEIKNILLHF